MKSFPFALLASTLCLTGCMATDAVPTATEAAPVVQRDIGEAAKALEGATTLDVERFQPQLAIGRKCEVRAIPKSTKEAGPALAKALTEAASYSETMGGLSLQVLHRGEIIHESFAEGVDAGTPTNAASMHKSVLALVIGQAIADGVIGSIDDPVGRYIVEWAGDPRGAITLRQLLTMSSGLKLYSFSDPGTKSLELLLAADINAVALDHPLVDKPDGEFRYNNANSQVLGVALERALMSAGKGDYPGYLASRLWCPVGNGPAAFWIDREGGSARYYAGFFAGSADWARIGELVRQGGKVDGRQIVPAGWIAEMAKPSAANPNYGLHLWRGSPWSEQRRYSQQSTVTIPHSAPYLAEDVLFFDGFGGQRVYIVPSAELTIVRAGMVNLTYDDAIIVNHVLRGLAAD